MATRKAQKWIDRKAHIRGSASLTGRQLADEFCAEGRAMGLTCDHIKPLKHGGRHHRGNLQWLSDDDNKRKKDKPYFYFRDKMNCNEYGRCILYREGHHE